MIVVIPIDQEELLVSIKEAKSFLFLKLGEGMQLESQVKKEHFSNELFDYIITCDKNDDLEEAYELGARALIARRGMEIEDIVEGLMFRELDEIL